MAHGTHTGIVSESPSEFTSDNCSFIWIYGLNFPLLFDQLADPTWRIYWTSGRVQECSLFSYVFEAAYAGIRSRPGVGFLSDVCQVRMVTSRHEA
jgi:hypothetical protein